MFLSLLDVEEDAVVQLVQFDGKSTAVLTLVAFDGSVSTCTLYPFRCVLD